MEKRKQLSIKPNVRPKIRGTRAALFQSESFSFLNVQLKQQFPASRGLSRKMTATTSCKIVETFSLKKHLF